MYIPRQKLIGKTFYAITERGLRKITWSNYAGIVFADTISPLQQWVCYDEIFHIEAINPQDELQLPLLKIKAAELLKHEENRKQAQVLLDKLKPSKNYERFNNLKNNFLKFFQSF